jgi:hypothetical protein
MTRMTRIAIALASALFASGDAWAKAEGVDSRASFPPVGCGGANGGAAGDCHVEAPTAELLVTIDGPDRIGTTPEDVGFYTLSIPPGSFGLLGAGFNVALAPSETGCELEPFGPSGKIGFQNESLDPFDPVLSHDYAGDAPPTTLVGVWSYQFLVLNCQTPGPLLLMAAMNAFDGSGDETGEVWNGTELEIIVPEPSALLLGVAALAPLAALSRAHGPRRHS